MYILRVVVHCVELYILLWYLEFRRLNVRYVYIIAYLLVLTNETWLFRNDGSYRNLSSYMKFIYKEISYNYLILYLKLDTFVNVDDKRSRSRYAIIKLQETRDNQWNSILFAKSNVETEINRWCAEDFHFVFNY